MFSRLAGSRGRASSRSRPAARLRGVVTRPTTRWPARRPVEPLRRRARVPSTHTVPAPAAQSRAVPSMHRVPLHHLPRCGIGVREVHVAAARPPPSQTRARRMRTSPGSGRHRARGFRLLHLRRDRRGRRVGRLPQPKGSSRVLKRVATTTARARARGGGAEGPRREARLRRPSPEAAARRTARSVHAEARYGPSSREISVCADHRRSRARLALPRATCPPAGSLPTSSDVGRDTFSPTTRRERTSVWRGANQYSSSSRTRSSAWTQTTRSRSAACYYSCKSPKTQV